MGYMLKRTGALKYAIGGRQPSRLLEWGLAQVPTSYLQPQCDFQSYTHVRLSCIWNGRVDGVLA